MAEKDVPLGSSLFDSESYTRVQSTLNHICEVFNCQVYIEDSGGRLLYTSEGNEPDAWRSVFVPFSMPSYTGAATLLAKWRTRMQIYKFQKVVLAEGEERILLPLAYQGNVFAIVHYVASSGTGLLQHFLNHGLTKTVSDKVYIVVIGSINITRKHYLQIGSVPEFLDLLRERDEHRGRSYEVVYLDFGDIDLGRFSSSVVDYSSVAMRHTKNVAKKLVALHEDGSGDGTDIGILKSDKPRRATPRYFLLHRSEDLLQTVILLVHDSEQSPVPLEMRLAGTAEPVVEVPMGLSPFFTNVEEIGDRIEQAASILELGRLNNKSKLVLSEHDIGFDAFVWQLFNTPQARAYAGLALRPLEQHPELMQTLETYFGANGNVTNTAEILVVDRRTITYRLERISDLLGCSVSNMETRVLLYLALKARKQL